MKTLSELQEEIMKEFDESDFTFYLQGSEKPIRNFILKATEMVAREMIDNTLEALSQEVIIPEGSKKLVFNALTESERLRKQFLK